MEKARYNTELYSSLRGPLNNVKPSNFWGSHQYSEAFFLFKDSNHIFLISFLISSRIRRNFGAQAGIEAEQIVKELLHKDYDLYAVCGQIKSSMDYSQVLLCSLLILHCRKQLRELIRT